MAAFALSLKSGASLFAGAPPALAAALGDIPGYHTQMLYLPAKKTTIVSIVNSDAADPNALTVAALGILLH